MSDEQNTGYKVHLFICTNQRDKGACCAGRGSAQLRDAVKKRCKQVLGEKAVDVRVNASGCLGHCEKGIVAVLYPEGKWFFDLKNDERTVENLVELVRQRT